MPPQLVREPGGAAADDQGPRSSVPVWTVAGDQEAEEILLSISESGMSADGKQQAMHQ